MDDEIQLISDGDGLAVIGDRPVPGQGGVRVDRPGAYR